MSRDKRVLITLSVLLFVYMTICFTPNLDKYMDNIFLYNRAVQILDCIKNGVYPYYYFNDYGGVGYGSSFFYGQLTLLPFVLFVNLGINLFIKIYLLVALVINYLGVYLLSKRFTKNYNIIALIYVSSSWYAMMNINANKMAIGLSIIFLAYCIDFFRDNKSFIKASLIFCLVFNTHYITSILSFLCCIVVLVYYFRSTKLLDYFKFFITTVALCMYNIFNMLWHYNDFYLDSNYLSGLFNNYDSSYCISPTIFSDLITRFILKDYNIYGTSYCSLVVLFVGLILFIKTKSKLNYKHTILLCLVFVMTILGLQDIWSIFYNDFISVVQYPIRYMPYILVFTLILLYRNANTKYLFLVLIVPLLSLFIPEYTLVGIDDSMPFRDYQIMGGEYLSSNYIRDDDIFDKYSTTVIADNGLKLEFSSEPNELVIKIPENSNISSITVPKLYYRGITNSMNFTTEEGYSQFTRININNWSGTLSVYYKHPLWLVIIQISCILLFVILTCRVIKDSKYISNSYCF